MLKVIFLGDANRPDAQTWLRGLAEFGDFQVDTWELPNYPGKLGRLKRMAAWLTAFRTLRQQIKREKYDIILAYRLSSYGYLAKAGKGLAPIVIAQQGISDVFPLGSWITPFKRRLVISAIKSADLVHAWGDAMVPALMRHGVDKRKLLVLAKGVDIQNFYPAPQPHQFAGIEGVVTRSLGLSYRHNIIIEATKLVKERNVPIHITIIGDGPLLSPLKSQAHHLGLQNEITFEGRIPNPSLPDYLRKANYYISTPITEGVSASLLEAMACGLYPVVTDLPGNRAWITDKLNGELVPPDNAVALAEKLIESFQDLERRQKAIAQNLAAIDEKAVYQKNLPQFIERYLELTAAWRKSHSA